MGTRLWRYSRDRSRGDFNSFRQCLAFNSGAPGEPRWTGLEASEALFWIKTTRYKQLPEAAQWTLTSNYIKFFGDLHVAGFKTVRAKKTGRTVKRKVIRSGEYFVSMFNGDVPDDMPWTKNILFDGKRIEGRSIYLEKGVYEVQLLPGARRSPRH